jgi:hypothetical protein
MEFAPPMRPLLPARWTRELNFLGWQQGNRQAVADLPAKTTLHLSLQWQEAHSPEYYDDPADPYRQPLAKLSVAVLRQRDPEGKSVSSDEMELITRSTGVPQRIANRRDGSTYELALECPIDVTGRYAVRIEGTIPVGILSVGTPTIPALARSQEIWPRLFVSSVPASSTGAGRPIFLDYTTDLGNLGTPADAAALLCVGAAQSNGLPTYASSVGPPMGRALLLKPNLLTHDAVPLGKEKDTGLGTGLAAPYVAGYAASLLSAAGTPADSVAAYLIGRKGQLLQAPPHWPNQVNRGVRPGQ